ncbi:hypothetical protein [Actinoplanes sp. NBRC 103695]|nr:hypothetical protein [Actinoplanes sp. NBRC 103695]GLZ01416.1 hypothetical protein Acsp02_86670 [Actinoplanes sp. NBRC 103695]
MTETLLAVAQEFSDGLSAMPWWALVAWLAFLFAAATLPSLID